MESITLTFGTQGYTKLIVSSVQNNSNKEHFLPIVVEENGPSSYLVTIFCDENIESVFPIFKPSQTSVFKFKHKDKLSPFIRVSKYANISSFPIDDKVYGIEILNKSKQEKFDMAGGHSEKNLSVWFGIENSRTETDGFQTDGKATIALNNTSTEKFRKTTFVEPFMVKKTFNFCFKSKMMNNLYVSH